jgi:hypothetical protein
VAPRPEPVDVRADRAVQGAITVIALGAFVFHLPWVVPVLAVLLAIGAARGPAVNPFHRIFAALVAPRLSPATTTLPAPTAKAQDQLEVALLVVATLCILIGLGVVGWFVTVVAAGIALAAATTGVHLGVMVTERIHRK